MNDESIMVAELAERVRDPSLKLIKSPTYDSLHTDGPCHPYTWCLGGKLCNGTMQPAAWRMVNHLLQQPDRADEYDELRQPVYGDPEHQADNNAFGSLRRAANKFFTEHDIPLRVGIKQRIVFLRVVRVGQKKPVFHPRSACRDL